MENLRRKEGQFFVKFGEDLPAPLSEIENLIKIVTKKETVIFEKCQRNYILDCGTLFLRGEILGLDGWKMGTGKVKVTIHIKRMGMSEIFRWVHGQLTVIKSDSDFYPSRVRGINDSTSQE